jgi:membrane-associated HD superfamily phosphohydrolase
MDNAGRQAINDKYGVPTDEDFKEHADKEQKELEESMKESFRQRDERKAREQWKKLEESGKQIRPYTKLEEQILRAGLKDVN